MTALLLVSCRSVRAPGLSIYKGSSSWLRTKHHRNFSMTQTTQTTTTSFVEQALSSILSSPHISISAPIPTGPGPVDLFSTRFNNTFTADAKGLVDGESVDLDGLKQKLLALQTHYDPASVKFYAQSPDSCQVRHGYVVF